MSSQILPYLVFTLIGGVLSLSTEFDLPSARIYTIAGKNRLTQWTKVDPATRETTIEHEDKIRLDCTANYAVQWIYTGDGIPAYTTTNKYSRTNAHGETTSEFISTIVIDPLKEHHTGKYQCSPGEQLDLRTFFYIFVPGQNIFTSLSGRNIVLSKNGSAVTIPCKVSHPNAAVTLEKSEAGNLRRVRVRADDAVTYDPKIGFTLKLNKIESPEGTYVCTARFGSYVRSVEYKVLPYSANYQSDQSIPAKLQNKCKKRCGENAYCDVIDGRETCQCLPEFGGEPDVKCVIKCNAHTDCPSTMSCFVDRQCRSPCIHSAHGCGINAVCRVENHRPVCACPKDWLGDETIQCFNSVQGSESDRSTPEVSPQSPQRPTKTPPTSSGIKCGSNTDCPDDMTCIRATASTTSGKTCVNPCQARRCGVNAECKVSERRSSCECLPGFFGDARLQCDKIGERENNPFSEPLIQADQEFDEKKYAREEFERWRANRCKNPEKCGANSSCRLSPSGSDQCLCAPGFQGQPPKCRAECKENSDCPSGHACVTDKRVGYPTCTKTCGSRVCGAHADCAQFDDGNYECYCPPGLHGDPLVKCESKEARLGRDCSTDYDCGIKLRCEIGADERKCVDPCESKTCRNEFVCEADNHAGKCVCPPGFTGNEYVGCNKDVTVDAETIPCANISCGENSECRTIGGKSSCQCQSGFVGKPPACIAECFSNLDCPTDLTCISKRCRHRCGGCGRNTRCRVAPNLERNSVCTCLEGFEGNPYVECHPFQ